tara:strand:- start:42 stop:2192 length:2151 start_codon:yes stop_codon:yes gene_type:complete
MATIVTRSGKGTPLTNNEVDANFNNLNTDKAELSGAVFTGAITTNSTIDGRDVATDGTKLDTVETNADITDATNVTAAGALMDSEVTNLAQVKAFDSSDYATAAQGTKADASLPKAGGAMTGAITTNSTFDGRDVATDGTKLDGIEASATADQTGAQIKTAYEAETNAFTDAQFTKLGGIETSADVTDTANVTSAGALMDSELTSIASVKALDQGVATTDSPTFAGIVATTADINGGTIDGTVIGGATAAAISGTTITATVADANPKLKAAYNATNYIGISHEKINVQGGGVGLIIQGNGTDRATFASGGGLNLANGDLVVASGNVGIGVTPAQLLHIKSAAPDIRIEDSDGGYVDLNGAGGNLELRADQGNAVGSSEISFWVDGGKKAVIDASGNVGIGVVPEAWRANDFIGLQIGTGAAVYGRGAGDEDKSGLTSNAYYDNTNDRWQHIATKAATNYYQNSGQHTFQVAPSGTADAAISWTTAMTIDNGGNVGIGTSVFTTNNSIKELVVKNTATNGVSSYTLTTTDNALGGGMRLTSFNDANALVFGVQTSYDEDGTSPPTERMRIDSAGRVTMPSQPAFSVKPASTQANIAINTFVTAVFGTEVFDVGANFASNTFTAPVTGKYQFNAVVRLDNMDTAAGYYYLMIATSNRTYYSIVDAGGLSSDPDYWSLTNSALADMDASDTAYVSVYQAGGASQTHIQADTHFTGYLAC